MRRSTATTTCLALLLGLLYAAPVHCATLNGTLTLGNISLDEDAGDLSAMQETYNIHDGFSVSQILLNGQLSDRNMFQLDLREINLDSRKGLFTYRLADVGDVTVRYDQHRQLFDADGAVSSERKDLRIGARAAMTPWLRVSGNYNHQTRAGDRLGYPAGNIGWLGNGYDYTLQTGRVEAEVHDHVRGLAVGYEMSDYADTEHNGTDRQGHVVSVRGHMPCLFLPDHVSHYVRAAFGQQELVGSGLQYDMASFQYVGVVKPVDQFKFKYDLYLSRVDDDATDLKTDDIRNNFDLTYFFKYGQVFGGYSYVTADDDRTLTSSNVWRVGAAGGYHHAIRAKVSYATSDKTDTEQLTLLKDVEQDRFRASLQSQPVENLTVGASYADRTREFPVINVKATGKQVSTFARVTVPGWGGFGADYTYSRDEYDDLVAGYDAESNVVTGRVDVDYIKNLRLSAAVSYLDIGKDLDIEKSILSFEGRYNLLDDYHIEVKYNVYNYDDYILLDRYYTANVVWVNIGYDFSVE